MDSKKAIINTIIYSDIFDYPLTKEEIFRYLIAKNKITKNELENALSSLLKEDKISKKEKWFYISGRSNIVNIRKKRGKESFKKWVFAKKVIFFLSRIPTIKLVGISGSLAMSNSEESEDIDLFIISRKNCLFITRFLSLLLLSIFLKRRKYNALRVSNLFCLNMLIDEKDLHLSKDLYTAHEILQLKVLVNKSSMYEKFLSLNKWVYDFMPNSRPSDFKNSKTRDKDKKISSWVLSVIEYLARESQLFYMRKKITTETITNTKLFFHPLDYRKKILLRYIEKQKIYGTI